MGYKFVDDIPFSKQWNIMLQRYSNILSKRDIAVLRDFGDCIGKSDVSGEINNTEMYQKLINDCIENAASEIKNKSKLYKTLGLALGVVISIFLV